MSGLLSTPITRNPQGQSIHAISGVTPDNAETLMAHADAAIVGTWLKVDGDVRQPVDAARVRELADRATDNLRSAGCATVRLRHGDGLALTWTGLDLTTSISGAATALANVGPGLGEIIGPAGNFAALNDTAKWLLTAAMLVGRLEILSVYVLFTLRFWRA